MNNGDKKMSKYDNQMSWDINVKKLPRHLQDKARFLAVAIDNPNYKENYDKFQMNLEKKGFKTINKTNIKIAKRLRRIIDSQEKQFKDKVLTEKYFEEHALFSHNLFEGEYKVTFFVSGIYRSTREGFNEHTIVVFDSYEDFAYNYEDVLIDRFDESDIEINYIKIVNVIRNKIFRGRKK